MSVVQPSEGFAPLIGTMRGVKCPLKPLEHHGNAVPKRLTGSLKWGLHYAERSKPLGRRMFKIQVWVSIPMYDHPNTSGVAALVA